MESLQCGGCNPFSSNSIVFNENRITSLITELSQLTLTLAFKWAFTLNEGECESEFLPPANEVWGKVIFSQACVKNSVHKGGAWSQGGSAPGGCLVLGGSAPRGVCSQGVFSRGGAGGDPPGMATAAGGKHHTGMHSCFWSLSLLSVYVNCCL